MVFYNWFCRFWVLLMLPMQIIFQVKQFFNSNVQEWSINDLDSWMATILNINKIISINILVPDWEPYIKKIKVLKDDVLKVWISNCSFLLWICFKIMSWSWMFKFMLRSGFRSDILSELNPRMNSPSIF